MTNYKDLGYDGFLRKELLPPDFVSGTRTDYLEGVNAGQLLTVGRISSQDGSFYIDLETGEISLPEGSVKTGMINYKSSQISAVVSLSGGSDFVNIQEAIDYTYRNGRGTVYISPGTYAIDYDIYLRQGVNLIGAGPDITILDFQNSSSYRIIINRLQLNSGTVSRLSISNLTVKNNAVSNNGSISIIDSEKIELKNIKFNTNNNGSKTAHDIYVDNTSQLSIIDCESLSSDNFINIYNQNYEMLIDRCLVTQVGKYAIKSDTTGGHGGDRITVSNSKFEDVANAFIYGELDHSTFFNNYFNSKTETSDSYSIFLDGDDNRFGFNRINSSATLGTINLSGNKNSLFNNFISEANNVKILYATTLDSTFNGNNMITGNTTYGVQFHTNSDRNSFTGNVLTVGGTNTGIRLDSGCDYNTIAGNTINATTDISDAGAGNVNSGNV